MLWSIFSSLKAICYIERGLQTPKCTSRRGYQPSPHNLEKRQEFVLKDQYLLLRVHTRLSQLEIFIYAVNNDAVLWGQLLGQSHLGNEDAEWHNMGTADSAMCPRHDSKKWQPEILDEAATGQLCSPGRDSPVTPTQGKEPGLLFETFA